jgi:hypothetical protein
LLGERVGQGTAQQGYPAVGRSVVKGQRAKDVARFREEAVEV